MCGRFNIISDPLTQLLMELTGQDLALVDQLNIAPTQQVPVLVMENTNSLEMRIMRWWLVPSWADKPSTRYSMFNARSDKLLTSKAYRGPFERRRCIMPVSGYYEWLRQNGEKIPYYVSPEFAPGLLFAGLWDRWQRDEQVIESCTLITTDAHSNLRDLHHRMPVMLNREQVHDWLDLTVKTGSLQRLFVPRLPTAIQVQQVSGYVNNSRNKGAECLKTVASPQLVDNERKLVLQ